MTDFKQIKSSFGIAGIPSAHYGSHLYNFDNKYDSIQKTFFGKLVKLTNQMLECNITKCPRYVFLCGCPGCGKTHYMVGLYRAMVQNLGYSQGDGALFIGFSSLASEMIKSFEDLGGMRAQLGGYVQSRWLFLDDFSASERVFKEGSMEFNLFRDILIDRYETNTTLVTSSNLNSEDLISELDRLFGGYVVSRMADSSVIQFPEFDFRKVK
jgi:DNA replication protein DnaC